MCTHDLANVSTTRGEVWNGKWIATLLKVRFQCEVQTTNAHIYLQVSELQVNV